MEMTIWLCVIIVTAIIEALTAGLVTIWFTFGALAAMICAMFGMPVVGQVIVFLIVSAALLVLTRPLAKKYFITKKTPTNADAVIGKQGIVTEAIDPLTGKGQVKIEGKIWSAKSDRAISENALVTIQEIQGVHVLVALANQEEPSA